MTMPEVSCKAVAMQNSSQWPCSMCRIPPVQTCEGEDILYIYFLDTLSSGPYYKSLFAPPPLGCTLLHSCRRKMNYTKLFSSLLNEDGEQ